MKIEDILSKEQLLKLQQSGYAGKNVYVPKIQNFMKKNLLLARYNKLLGTVKKTSAIEILSNEFNISVRNLYRIIKNNGQKICGIKKENVFYGSYADEWKETLKDAIRKRDNYTCQLCNKQQNIYALPIHHIDYNKKNCSINNLITLCKKCHGITNGNREYWKNYLPNKIKKS